MTAALRNGTATQTTQVEQARATADVLAAMEAAKRWPRDEDAAERKMIRACQRQLVADRAFWNYRRSGENLTGPTVDLARTIGALWGNLQWGIAELSRDDAIDSGAEGGSQMIAWAWELETNTRASTAFVVPHARDTKARGRQRITELRDVYENNANNGARRVREMVLGLLPDWYVETAIQTCQGVIEQKDRPIGDIRREVGGLIANLGVSRERVLARVGRTDWNDTTRGDLATLRIAAQTIDRGEGTVRELFPEPAAPQVTASELAGRRPAPEPAPEPPPANPPADGPEDAVPGVDGPPAPRSHPDDTPGAGPVGGRLALAGQKQRIAILTGEAGLDRDGKLALCRALAGRDDITSTDQLTTREAADIVQTLEALRRDHGDGYATAVGDVLEEAEHVAHERRIAEREAGTS